MSMDFLTTLGLLNKQMLLRPLQVTACLTLVPSPSLSTWWGKMRTVKRAKLKKTQPINTHATLGSKQSYITVAEAGSPEKKIWVSMTEKMSKNH